MIELGRSMLKAVSWLLDVAGRALATDKATLAVLVPESVPEHIAEQLAGRVFSMVRSRAEELGIASWWDPALTREADRRCVAVRLGDRPIALVTTPYSASAPDDWAESVVDAVDAAVRRRLSVLADIRVLLAAIGIPEPGPAHVDAVGMLLDCGVSWRRVTLDLLMRQEPRAHEMDLGELLVEKLAPHEIVLEVPESTLRSVDSSTPDEVVLMRTRLYADRGLRIPDIRLVIVRNTPGKLGMQLNDVFLRRPLSATARWDDVVAALDDAVREAASWFVTISEVKSLLEQLVDALPNLVNLVQRSYSDARLAGCLREMVRQGDSIRNLPRILWLLMQMVEDVDPDDVIISDPILLAGSAAVGRVIAAPASLAAAMRRIDAEEATGDGSSPSPVLVVPPEVEDVLRHPGDPHVVAAAEHTLLDLVVSTGEPSQVEVGHSDAVAGVRAALQPLLRPPRVVSRQERPLRAAM